MKVLLYSTGEIYSGVQTGGKKRFIELVDTLCKKKNADLCCSDNKDVLENHGVVAKYSIKKPASSVFFRALPPEMVLLLSNVKLVKQIKQTAYDSIVVFDVPPAVGLCVFGVKNLVLMIRKDMIGYEKIKCEDKKSIGFYFKLFYQWMSEAICLKKAKVIICQCEYDKEKLLHRHSLMKQYIKHKFIVQINNVNPTWIVNNSLRETKVEFDIEHKSFNICFVGGFDDLRKGQDILLSAAKILVKDKTQFSFYIIGGGKNLAQYKKIYKSERIHFLGRLENPIPIMKQCNLMVVPSLADSCPNTVMEALYNGIPVIASREGGIPEILKNNDALFELDPKSLALKILEIACDEKAIDKLKEQQRVRKEQLMFDWGEMICSLIGV